MAIGWSQVPAPEVRWLTRADEPAEPYLDTAAIGWSQVPAPEVRWLTRADEPAEPYLDTASDGVTLTPHRTDEADVRAIVVLSNIPQVAKWSFRREYPYERTHALSWLLHQVPPARVAGFQLSKRLPLEPPHCPFNVIRLRGELVGDCDLFKTEEGWCLGYTMHPDQWGRGIATAAARALIAWGRDNLDMRELHAHVEEANMASQAVVTKLGFSKTGTEMQEWPAHHGGGEREVGQWILRF